MKKLRKSMHKAALAATLCAALISGTTSIAPATPAYAWDTASAIGALISVGAQYAYAEKQLSYLNGDGRFQYMNQVKQQVGVDQAPEANAMLRDVMTRLSASIAQTDPSIKQKPYNYFVNKQKSFNAFCTLGHNLSVNIGLFEDLNYNEDEIAFVVAHELGHGEKNHPAAGVRKALPLELLSALYASQNPNSASILGATVASRIGTAKMVTKPMESEADKLAFGYAVGAGYNPGAGAAVWQRVIEKVNPNGGKSSFISDLFNDHPGNIARRDKYNDTMYEFSNKKVHVDPDTGMILIKGKNFYTPKAADGMTAKERSYLIAGNLSAVFHNRMSERNVWTDGNNILMVGPQPIMVMASVAEPAAVQDNLQRLVTTTGGELKAAHKEELAAAKTTVSGKKVTTVDDEARKRAALQKRLDKIAAQEPAATGK